MSQPPTQSTVIETYGRLLKEKPVRTKATVAFFGGFISSLLSQRIADPKAPIVWSLAFKFALRGTPPFSHWWFNLLDGVYNEHHPAAKALHRYVGSRLWRRVVADQFFWRPTLIMYSFTLMAFLKGDSVKEWKHAVSTRFLETWSIALRIGIPQAIVNQGFVPLEWRQPFLEAVSLVWNTLLALRVARAQK
eukprot:gnl/MRDRNA2_/MRDRNA2_59267_c0_seq1.p1 gnl/MRDRNA2_/MRDRNA2_59267_c0~~gnl/MRDRNA2_/MRDRNA2_59267_c0_seq1.p1  ORF type:complete len:191 (-),score=27.80 gnl/MRDRNA2_/MRDRNA2_59267_c0_seq1:455-1027(-)